MDEIYVRKAVLSDIPYLYEICLKTGDEGKDASALYNDPYLIGHYFAAPYLLFHEGICFVAEYEHRPQGYILSVPDSAAFGQWMEEQWLPPLRKRYLEHSPQARPEKEQWIINLMHKKQFPIDINDQPWIHDYPAHLHIDLLPAIQRKGIGQIFLNNLFSELIRQNVPGLSFGVGMQNAGAIQFYQKMGFSVLQEQEWGYVMGKLFR